MNAPSRRALVGLLAAEAVSLTGTRLSMLALPWFVLTTTGSATRTGLVTFAEMAPYVVIKALGGPVIDRLGPRPVSIGADAASALFVGAIPLLYLLGWLPFWSLVGLVALAGSVRGPGDAAKDTLIPDVTSQAQVPLERVTGLSGTIERLASTVGPAVAGLLIGWLDAVSVLALDAATFVAAGVIIAGTAPSRHRAAEESSIGGYLHQLGEGLAFLRRERLLRSLIVMVGTTNLLDAALTVLILLWARDHGLGASAVGLTWSVMGVTAVLGSLAAAGIGHRLPRRTTYLVGFFVAGAPRFVVLALGAPLWLVLVINAVSGLGAGFLNPIINAVVIERIPRPLLGRVGALGDSMAWAGIPFGEPVGAGLVTLFGLAPALLACGAVYLLATTLPGLRPEWREMDRQGTGEETCVPATRRTGLIE